MANAEESCPIPESTYILGIRVRCLSLRSTGYRQLTAYLRFYFPGVLVGPYLEFAEYMDLIDGTLFKALEKADEAKRSAATIPGRLVPRGRKRVAYRKMLMGLVYLGLFVVLGGQYNYSIAVADSFTERSLFYRYVNHA